MTYSAKELRARGVSEQARELRALRRSLKVSQAELAAMAGVSAAAVNKYELGLSVHGRVRRRIEDMMARWQSWLPRVHAARGPERRGRYNHNRDRSKANESV